MSPIFFLAVQYNFKNFQHISRLMILSMASVRLWYHWTCSRSISSASSPSGGWNDSPPRCAAWIDDKGRKSNYTRHKIAMQFNWNNNKELFPRNIVVLREVKELLTWLLKILRLLMKAEFSLPSKAEVLTTVDEDSDYLGRENLSVGK